MIKEIGGNPLSIGPALTGVGDRSGIRMEEQRPFAEKKIGTYTLGLAWGKELTPTITTRILRDCFQLARICRTNRTDLKVACESTSLDKFLKFIDVSRTTDLKNATYWRIYCTNDDDIPEVPEHAELSDIIILEKPQNPQKLVYDPTFPAKVEYIDVQEIQDTVPLYQAPVRGPADWNQQMEPF